MPVIIAVIIFLLTPSDALAGKEAVLTMDGEVTYRDLTPDEMAEMKRAQENFKAHIEELVNSTPGKQIDTLKQRIDELEAQRGRP